MRKNRNALMVEAIVKHINAFKKICTNPVMFEEFKSGFINRTIETKRELGDTEFLNSKELKQYLIEQKLNDIEKDF